MNHFVIQNLEDSLVDNDIKEKLVKNFCEDMHLSETSRVWDALLYKKGRSLTEIYTINDEEHALVSRHPLFQKILIKSFHLTHYSLLDMINAIVKNYPKYAVYLYTMKHSKTYEYFSSLNVRLDSFTLGDNFFDKLTMFSIDIDQDFVYRAIFHCSLNEDFLDR